MINHVYTQEEQDILHDIYIELHDLEETMHEVSNCRDNIRDELIPNLSDGCIVMAMLSDDIFGTIRFINSQLKKLIGDLHNAEIGYGD